MHDAELHMPLQQFVDTVYLPFAREQHRPSSGDQLRGDSAFS
jgi:uncharacterized protein YceK